MKRTGIYMVLAMLAAVVVFAGAETTPARRAVRELAERASAGDAEAMYRLAYLHDTGYDSIAVDTLRSTALYQAAADSGYIPALNYLGFRYYRGEGVERDVERGLSLIRRAAEAGDAHAANNMGWLLLDGEGVEHNVTEAVEWLEKASEGGVARAKAMLADLYSDGKSLPADTLRAARLYSEAIDGGVADAQARLVNLMRSRWDTLPADSLVDIGLEYYTRRAPLVGVDLFLMAARNQNPRALALLGDAYSRAVGADYDYSKSLQYFVRAALLGHPSAQFFLGETLEIFPDALEDAEFQQFAGGEVLVFPESRTSMFWLERAAAQGISSAEAAAEYMFAE